MRAVLRRVRAYAGHLGLLAVLGLTAALVFSAFPRAANEFVDRGLRADVSRLPFQSRDLTYVSDPLLPRSLEPGAAAGRLSSFEDGLPAALRGLVAQRWFAAKVGPGDLQPSGQAPFAGSCRPEVQVRHQTGYEPAARITDGRLPRSGREAEVLVEAGAAAATSLRPGSELAIQGVGGAVTVTVVGVFRPADAASPFWDGIRTAPAACPNPDDGMTTRITLLTDLPGVTRAGRGTGTLAYEWRYRISPARLHADDLPELTTAVLDARRPASTAGFALSTGLDGAFGSFEQQLRGVRALLAVVRAGLIATMLGLIVLAARLLTDRRREEYALLRARGATTATVVTRTFAETAVVVPAAVLGGWALSLLVPGRPDPGEWLLVGPAGITAVLAAPVLAGLPPGDARGRRDLVRSRPSPRRLTAEVFVLLVAVLGVLLVRRRGLTASAGVDPYLVSVPVLLGVAAALVAVRLIPWPLRQISRATARARGVVPFLGLARAGRGSPLSTGPLAVLVVAIATGVFTAAVSGTVSDARDRATDREIPADAEVHGFAFAPGTAQGLAAVPGVTAVTPLLRDSGTPLTAASGRRTQAQLMVVDGAAAAKVMAASGVGVRLPAVLGSPRTDGPVPAVVSPAIAEEVGAGGAVTVQGRRYDFRVAAVEDSLPGLDIGARRFIAVGWRALPVPDFQPIVPNGFLVQGDGFATAALRDAGDAGQREQLGRVLGHEVTDAALPGRATVTTWEQRRAELADTGVNGVLTFTYTAGAAGAVVLAILAVGLTVLADAPGRGRTLSRLRTMGLSLRQGRRLLVYELTPLLTVAVLAGGLIGVLLPRLVGPALGLDAFTAGVSPRTRVHPWLPAAALLLIAAALAVAVLVEHLANRRMRLGEALRLGEET